MHCEDKTDLGVNCESGVTQVFSLVSAGVIQSIIQNLDIKFTFTTDCSDDNEGRERGWVGELFNDSLEHSYKGALAVFH